MAERENRARGRSSADAPEKERGRRERSGGRAVRRSRAKVIALIGALLPVFLIGLVFTRAANAATTSVAAWNAHSTPAAAGAAAPAEAASPAAPAKATAPAPSGPCAIPIVGDLGALAGLCNAGSGAVGSLNNICSPGTPQPEQATSGLNAMIDVPGGSAGGKTLYDQYGVAGQNWNATNLQCSDMTSLIGNDVSNMTFNFAKTLDRLTITVYQAAAGNDILNWLSSSVDRLISALGNAIYFPYLAPVVILGAIWLAWQGLVRKRATRTIEGTIWMVLACAAAVWLIGRPGDFTGIGTTVSNSVTNVMNVAFAKLPAPQGANCLPVGNSDPQSVPPSYAFTSGNGFVDENANELWSVLVCKPWVLGEFGTTQYATSAKQTPTVVNAYGRELLWAQAIAANEQATPALIQQKQNVYQGIASQMQTNYPAVYPLFQGNQWTTRLEIGFGALFAAAVAGLLVLLIALTLILLKLGFLLLLVAGPFFLIIGTHPGFGRVIAIRWFEMLVGVLLKQIAIALMLSVLLYCYSLIMGTPDTALPWALKIIMIALVTVAVFIYRKPFQHLFSAVGYGMLGADARADVSLREATFGFRRATAGAAGAAAGLAGGVAGSMAPGAGTGLGARWARRFGDSAAPAAGDAAAGGSMAGAAAAAANGARSTADGTAGRGRPEGPGGSSGSGGGPGGPAGGPGGPDGGSGGSGGGRGKHWPESGYGSSGRAAPPLPLPGSGGPGSGTSSAGWARSSGSRNTGPMPRAGSSSSSGGTRATASSGGTSGGSPGGTSSRTARPATPPAPPPAVRRSQPAAGSSWRPFRRGK